MIVSLARSQAGSHLILGICVRFDGEAIATHRRRQSLRRAVKQFIKIEYCIKKWISKNI
jgi:hypothetical protein